MSLCVAFVPCFALISFFLATSFLPPPFFWPISPFPETCFCVLYTHTPPPSSSSRGNPLLHSFFFPTELSNASAGAEPHQRVEDDGDVARMHKRKRRRRDPFWPFAFLCVCTTICGCSNVYTTTIWQKSVLHLLLSRLASSKKLNTFQREREGWRAVQLSAVYQLPQVPKLSRVRLTSIGRLADWQIA